MLERQLSYEAFHAPAQKAEPHWLFRRHVAEFKSMGSSEDNALYLKLSGQVHNFNCFPGALREQGRMTLPLKSGFFRATLTGAVAAEYVSGEKGERRSHLESLFPLPGGW